jgi:RNA polymerase sigma-70 factor, ECF subfamily
VRVSRRGVVAARGGIPAERLAFVLHDVFAVPFDEIAPIVDRTPEATRKLASRARRRIERADPVPDGDLAAQREAVDAFFAAGRTGDFDRLVSVLHPDVVLRGDFGAGTAGFRAEGCVLGGPARAQLRRIRAGGARRHRQRRRGCGRMVSVCLLRLLFRVRGRARYDRRM